tara:strand:+ start:3870 stop:4808 length:939 start_codon:yes stop_codon:yes gene_type:complete
MKYRKLGRSGLDVSAVGLGTNNFGRKLDFKASETVILSALDNEINTIDTSNSYGDGLSEEYIGKSLKGRRQDAVLATKVASPQGEDPNNKGASRKHILEQVEISLKRLQTDYIDLYQIHFPDPHTPIDETLLTLDDLVKSGKILYAGCSNFASWQLAQAMERAKSLQISGFVSIQPHYSILQREIESEILPCCVEYGVGILPYFPLENGLLTGKYKRNSIVPKGSRLSDGSPRSLKTLDNANYDLLEKLEEFSENQGRSMVELAIAWLLSNKMISTVIAGATKPEQIQLNAKGSDWNLSEEDIQYINEILGD